MKFTSRKFLLALSAAAAFFSAKQYAEAAGVVVAYVAAEAGLDLAAVRKSADAVVAEVDTVLDTAEATEL